MRAVTPRLALSVPGAIGGALLVCALAFGASFGSDRAPKIDEHDAGARVGTVAESGDDSAMLGDDARDRRRGARTATAADAGRRAEGRRRGQRRRRGRPAGRDA